MTYSEKCHNDLDALFASMSAGRPAHEDVIRFRSVFNAANKCDFLLRLFKARAVQTGRFTLASGKESTYYINSKKAIFNSEAAWLIGDVLYDLAKDLNVQAIGGLEIGAIPMATAAAMRFHEEGKSVEAFFVRKQAKGHGSQDRLEGGLKAGDRVAVVEDVMTTGGSVLQAVEEVEKAGAKVVLLTCIVDRLEGAREKLGGKYNYQPIFTIRDFGIEPPTKEE